jgi:hypothetical protein
MAKAWMEGHMIRNLLSSLSHERSQADSRSWKNVNDTMTDLGGADGGILAFGDDSLPAAPANVAGQVSVMAGADAALSSGGAKLLTSGTSGPTTVIAGADAALSSGGAVLLTAGPTTITVGAGDGGMVFKDSFDSSCTQAYITCVVDAENAIIDQWINPITLNLDFSLKANGTNADMEPNTASSGVNVTYAQLRNALQAKDWASPDTYAQTAAWFLPTSSPAGTTDFTLPEAYARMLGLSSATPAVDGNITLNSSFNWSFGQDVINATEHQISECVMGRVGGLGDNQNGWSTMDLFRYNSSGVLDTTDGRDGQTTFFSFNGGSTLSSLEWNNLFNTSGQKVSSDDTSDFAETDVFGAGSTGETDTLSATDLNVMDVLGWIPNSPHRAPSVGVTNLTLWENTSINGLGLEETTNPASDNITRYAFRDTGSNGYFTLNGTPEQNGQWVYVDTNALGNLVYHAGAQPGADTIQVTAYDTTLMKFLDTVTFSATTTVEPVAYVKNFAVSEGQSLAIGPITGVSNPSGDTITEYALMDAGTHGHFAVSVDVGTGVTAEPNSQWFVIPAWDTGAVQYVGGTAGSDPIEVEAFDVSADRWTAISSATATTRQTILPPPGGGGPSPTPVHALDVTNQASGAASVAPLAAYAADTLVAGFADATLVGGPGSDTFVINPSVGQETIQNFDPAHDTLQFNAALFANYAAAMTDARQVGASTVFTIDAHDSVTLPNIGIGSLTAGNVHFG